MNQTLPSGPAVMLAGLLLAVGIRNVEKRPAGVIRPIAPLLNSVNHRLPSEPAVIPSGPQPAEDPYFVGKGNSVVLPDGVIRPILFELISVNPVPVMMCPGDSVFSIGLLSRTVSGSPCSVQRARQAGRGCARE